MNTAGRSRGFLDDKPLATAIVLIVLLVGSIWYLIFFSSGFGLGLESWLSSVRPCNREVVSTAQEAAGVAKKILADRNSAIFTIGLKSWKEFKTDDGEPQRWELQLLILSHLRRDGTTTSFSTAVKFVIVNTCGHVLSESDATAAPEVESVGN
jgi:hypothetical protein